MSLFMRNLLGVYGLAFTLLLAPSVRAEQVVNVASVYFPPYVFKLDHPDGAGLLMKLLDALNLQQSEFRFVALPTSVRRRHIDFQQGRVDLAIFENPEWGWQDIAHISLDMGLEDSEVFVSRIEPGREQSYFDDLRGKRLALYHGYHYAFAGFNAEPTYLAETFNATLTQSHDSNLLMVLRGRADIALVTRSYIDDFLQRNPEYIGQMLVSERADQRYRHHVLLRPDSPISAAQFDTLLESLRRGGQLTKIFAPYQIAVAPVRESASIAAGARK